MQCIWFIASTVNGTPSRLLPHTTHTKQLGWYGFPVALKTYIQNNLQINYNYPTNYISVKELGLSTLFYLCTFYKFFLYNTK